MAELKKGIHELLKKLLRILWPYGAVNRDTPAKTRLIKGTETILTVSALLWLASSTVLLPAWFPHNEEHYGYTVYSQEKLDSDQIRSVLSAVKAKTEKSKIYTKNEKISVYLYGSRTLFDIFFPGLVLFNNDVEANYENYIMWSRIHISYADVSSDVTNLVDLLAHETVHDLQAKRYGFFSHFLVPKWVLEGYPEYVVSNPDWRKYKNRLIRVRSGKKVYPYFKYWLLVRHAIEKMGYSVDDLHENKVSRDAVEKSLLRWLEDEELPRLMKLQSEQA